MKSLSIDIDSTNVYERVDNFVLRLSLSTKYSTCSDTTVTSSKRNND